MRTATAGWTRVWVIHAGRGQEYGGGQQAQMSIWSRATDVDADRAFPGGYVIHDNDNSNPADDLRLGPVTHVPEDSDIGVLIEEFGHSFFDLPDLYTMNSLQLGGLVGAHVVRHLGR